LRAHTAAAHHVDHSDDFTRVQGAKYEPVQVAGPAVLRMASAAAAAAAAADAGVAAFVLQDDRDDHSKAEGDSDDDIVALS
jgi:alkanesulfonate monooxygenase SsuD/methylene tetrahydromethanopterin reductase-like flavin-dependent oxidoreductase (luciferase family)